MSSVNDSLSIFHYHRYMIAMYGNDSSHALGWRDEQSQAIRFKALAGLADMNGHSVLDAGCGYGDFRQLFPGMTYIGIEQIPELLDEAVNRYGNWPDTTFMSGNFNIIDLLTSDYVVASGSLNYLSEDPGYIFKAIARLFKNCKIGFGFNLLSKVKPNDLIVAYDPVQIMAYCKSVCREVKMINDYDVEDFTVYMYK
ncbi:trans-aconitate 2-methyltransferase [Mucilaginibacter sp.]|uniref:class I SAM-dependent methyltransferase n=1 Tax=Mucilaginibacter sp. TaxID=1882438 RepID=UPI0026364FD7|nr:class I SAM-dependent methyltransferase [Mucilaginibacter sp.]MDB4922996.1 tam 2 [Mucilaginibacter sp.]